MYPFLTYSERRDLREKLYTGYIMRGDNDNEYDNKNITSKIASLRVEKANILGFETHAHYVLDNTMAKTPEAVYELLNQLWEPALSRAQKMSFKNYKNLLMRKVKILKLHLGIGGIIPKKLEKINII